MFIFEEEVYPRTFQDQVLKLQIFARMSFTNDALTENANVGTRFNINTTTN